MIATFSGVTILPLAPQRNLLHKERLEGERSYAPLFWSGQSFDEDELRKEGSFEAAEARYTAADQVNLENLKRWLGKARDIQWDYKNIVRRKGRLEGLK